MGSIAAMKFKNYVDDHTCCCEERLEYLVMQCRKYLRHDMTKAEFKEVVEQYYPRELV